MTSNLTVSSSPQDTKTRLTLFAGLLAKANTALAKANTDHNPNAMKDALDFASNYPELSLYGKSLKSLVSDTRVDSVGRLIDTVIQGIMQQIASPTIVVNLPEEMKVDVTSLGGRLT